MSYRVPLATYRLQFNSSFTFDDARRIAPYLRELGISDLYASPILKARKGSQHGYDVVDANALNPELGTDEDFEALHAELAKLGLGLLLDIVPNHMAASAENSWWMSVLENGQDSRLRRYFDIDFTPVTLHGQTILKVVLPILGRPFGEAVDAREIVLAIDADGFYFSYFEHRLPLAPASYDLILREAAALLPDGGEETGLGELLKVDKSVPNSKFLKEKLWPIYENDAPARAAIDEAIEHVNRPARGVIDGSARRAINGSAEGSGNGACDRLEALLDAQWYRLAYWRIAREKINYRRFFDVTDLVGLRVEEPEVFEERYRRTLELIAQGKVNGLRIDHIDGLLEPVEQMRKLQALLTSGSDEQFYIVVEKILAHDEVLPRELPVAGTTGYDFLDSMNTVFVDPAGLARLTDFYRSFTGNLQSFDDLCYERKKQVIHELFSGEMRALGKRLSAMAMVDRNARDFAPGELLATLTEITASLRVYRTYLRDGHEPSGEDRRRIAQAVQEARLRAGTAIDERLFAFLERILLTAPSAEDPARGPWLDFVQRWQQFTGRVMAKGVEDTAFYNYNRLLSLNEVGGEPGRDGDFDPVAELHARNARVLRDWPDTMNASSTHDTKRSQDVRARINVLSEVAEEWERQVRKWTRMNEALRIDGIPGTNEELLVYQTLVGMWPLDDADVGGVPERLKAYLEKAAREAKTHTSWISPDAEYEQRFLAFGEALLNHEAFRASLVRFQKRIAFHGFLNGLAQLVLEVTAPGVPDFYQGTELWDLSLVDPDNRRPVDYEQRASMLRKLKAAHERGTLDAPSLVRRWSDGRVKLFVSWRALDTRARHAETFRRGAYTALHAGANAVSFLRGDDILVAVPRLTTRIAGVGKLPEGNAWGDTAIAAPGRWRNVFTSEELERDRLRLADVFATFPVAILERT